MRYLGKQSLPIFVNISIYQIKKFSIQKLYFDSSVSIAAIRYNRPKSAVLVSEQLLVKERTCAKFQIDISKTEELVRVYTNGRTGGSAYWIKKIKTKCLISKTGLNI